MCFLHVWRQNRLVIRRTFNCQVHFNSHLKSAPISVSESHRKCIGWCPAKHHTHLLGAGTNTGRLVHPYIYWMTGGLDVCSVVYRCYLNACKDTVWFGRIGRCLGEYRTGIVSTLCEYQTGIRAWKSRNQMINVLPSSGFCKGIWRAPKEINLSADFFPILPYRPISKNPAHRPGTSLNVTLA